LIHLSGRAGVLAAALLSLCVAVRGAQAQQEPGPIVPLVGTFDPLGFAQLKRFTAHRSSSNNVDPNSNDDSKRPIPGETIVIADLKGPGIISHIWLTVAANEYGWPRLLRLRVYYDGSTIPSVDAPVGDFFGVGHGIERPINSLMIRNASSGRSRNSYWPMPFRRSVRVTLTNEGRRRISNVYYHVDWLSVPSLPANTGYFHARYKQALPARAGAPLNILDVRGRGHYVGTVLSVIQVAPGWFGEGDDLFYVDGKRKPDIEGTGSEDYFNDAWSLRVAEGPYAGVPIADGTDTGARMTAYRWHLVDPIPFTTRLRFDIEHFGWTYNADGTVRSGFEERPDLFSTVAFWYQLGVAKDQPEPPYGPARLPHGNAKQIEVETLLDDVRATGGKARVDRDVFWSKDLLVFDSARVGSRIDIPLEVPDSGRYELLAQVGEAPDYGTYQVLIDGRAPGDSGVLEHEPGANTGGPPSIDGYFSEIFVGEDRVIGWPTLGRGRHTVTFVCTGKNSASSGYTLGLDALVLARVAGSPGVVTRDSSVASDAADRIRRIGALGPAAAPQLATLTAALKEPDPGVRVAAAWSLTQLGKRAAPAIGALGAALRDSDQVVRGLAALALRDAGPIPDSTIDLLATRLGDPDENVRLMSAAAIGAQGKRAFRALDQLVALGRSPGQHPHVLRNVAAAIGAMGPQASSSLPLLQDLWKIPRVRWAAALAIQNVGGAVPK